MFRYHTWEWLLARSISREVLALRSFGFGGAKVMVHFYHGYDKKTGVMAKCERKIIAFNRGEGVRIMEYSSKVAKGLNLETTN